jgi:hypothetical protein
MRLTESVAFRGRTRVLPYASYGAVCPWGCRHSHQIDAALSTRKELAADLLTAAAEGLAGGYVVREAK